MRAWMLLLLGWAVAFSMMTVLCVHRKPGDGRSKTMRVTWGAQARVKLLVFFQARRLLDIFLSPPFLAVALQSDGQRTTSMFVSWFTRRNGKAGK